VYFSPLGIACFIIGRPASSFLPRRGATKFEIVVHLKVSAFPYPSQLICKVASAFQFSFRIWAAHTSGALIVDIDYTTILRIYSSDSGEAAQHSILCVNMPIHIVYRLILNGTTHRLEGYWHGRERLATSVNIDPLLILAKLIVDLNVPPRGIIC
jgi:hypothetical protein